MGVQTVKLFSDWVVHLTKNHDLIIASLKLLLLSGPHFIFIYSLLFRRGKKKERRKARKGKRVKIGVDLILHEPKQTTPPEINEKLN